MVQPDSELGPARAVGGILLTGGRSSRLGVDKASLPTPDGSTLALRTARVLAAVTDPAIEVGPGLTDLRRVEEDEPRGPLGAIVAAVEVLHALAGPRPALVVATDLPRITERVLRALVDVPGHRSVVPSVGGVPQVLCARYSATFLSAAVDAFAAGERALTRLVRHSDAELLAEDWWADLGGPEAFADVDTSEDLTRMIATGDLRSSDRQPG